MTLSPTDWLSLLLHFGVLSLLSVGGGISVVPDMHRYLVVEQGWLTHPQFTSSVALAQIAPGPNVLFVALMGWNVGVNAGSVVLGVLGAALCLMGLVIPSSLLTLLATRWAHRNQTRPGVRAFKAGLTPLVVALLASTAWLLLAPSLTAGNALAAALLVLGATLVLWRTSIHLLWMLAAGAVVGGLGWM
ncbi:MAG: chromate transporter [Hydrogenophaga sp.]|jgi:chromate transporter|nr:chromate transporter [Hydrogenophaga sp.]MDP3326288.1 chromate transporter [Hydrogenophaga sp.]